MVNRCGVEVVGGRVQHPLVAVWPPVVEFRPAVVLEELRDEDEVIDRGYN